MLKELTFTEGDNEFTVRVDGNSVTFIMVCGDDKENHEFELSDTDAVNIADIILAACNTVAH